MHPMILDELRRSIIATPADYKAAVLADSPSVLWMLDETSGTTVVDSSGNGNDNVYRTGYTLDQPGLINGYNCTEWAGAGYAYKILPVFNAQVITVEAVVLIDSLVSNRTILHHGYLASGGNQGWRILVLTNGELYLQTFGNGAWIGFRSSFGIVPVGVPVHIGITYDGPTGVSAVYINGVYCYPDNDTLGSTGLSTSAYNTHIAVTYNPGYVQYMDGKIAGLAFWAGTALDEATIQKHYAATGL